jgi:2-amino-4-hydroxy-6-hydroxymethyldihydropteridine diphosphokinase
MIRELLQLSERVDVSRIVETVPINLENGNNFLNLSTRINYLGNAQELKKQLNAIETKLGRDRSDVRKKWQNRTADLDIIFALKDGANVIDEQWLPSEPFIKPQLLELIHFLKIQCAIELEPIVDGVTINMDNICLGKHPVSLFRNP